MLRLELLQQICLALLITGHTARLLLSLVVHHLLHHRARLTIQVTQVGVLGRDLSHVDLGPSRHHMRPPLLFVDLVEVNGDFLAWGSWGGLEGPGRFVHVDRMGEVTLGLRS